AGAAGHGGEAGQGEAGVDIELLFYLQVIRHRCCLPLCIPSGLRLLHTRLPGMTPATTPGAGLPRLPGQPGEVPGGGAADDDTARAGALSPAATRALLVAGAIVAAVAGAAYVTALATHPWKSLLNGFDLQVYLGGARQALHHAGNLYSWHYQHHPG